MMKKSNYVPVQKQNILKKLWINENIKYQKESIYRKLKKMKNMLKETLKVSPCLLTALAEQENVLLIKEKYPIKKNISYCMFSKWNTKVIQNWKPHPEINYYLWKWSGLRWKKKKEEYFIIFTINVRGQTAHNNFRGVCFKRWKDEKKYESF